LLADGLLDPARKRELPEFPHRIVIITSIAGAAVRDVITVARRRWPGIELLVINSTVQGDRAAAELVEAFGLVERLDAVDCCIVGRGGGAKEDLAAFNDEAVCRAIAACKVPVISAVGHEVDVTLADLVADRRAATPSQAAEFAIPDRRDTVDRVVQLESVLTNRTRSILGFRRERLQRTGERMGNSLLRHLRVQERRLSNVHGRLPASLERHVREPRERLQRATTRLEPAIMRRTELTVATIERLAGKLDALSPVRVLGRGYSLARGEDGTVLRNTADFSPGMKFNLKVVDGDVTARVEKT
jgi:exodeoxyribonuclease VII large subunit